MTGVRRFVLNTHVHIDHYGGNEVMADLGATILAHEVVREKMLRGHHTPRWGGSYGAQPPEGARPILTFSGCRHVGDLNGEEVRVLLVTRGTGLPLTASSTSWTRTSSTSGTCSGPTCIRSWPPTTAGASGLIAATETATALSLPNTKVIPGDRRILYGPRWTHRRCCPDDRATSATRSPPRS